MAVELVIGIVLVALLAGVGIGYYLLGAGRTNKAKAAVAELESALETAQTELADYKGDVFGQFAQTAEKFRALDKSYNDLHRQLAESSVALCGDDGTLLLESPAASALDIPASDIVDDQLADEEIVVAEASGSEQPETEADDPEPNTVAADASAETEAQSGSTTKPQVEIESASTAEPTTEIKTEQQSADVVPDTTLGQDQNQNQDPDAVPILTEVESTEKRRESA